MHHPLTVGDVWTPSDPKTPARQIVLLVCDLTPYRSDMEQIIWKYPDEKETGVWTRDQWYQWVTKFEASVNGH